MFYSYGKSLIRNHFWQFLETDRSRWFRLSVYMMGEKCVSDSINDLFYLYVSVLCTRLQIGNWGRAIFRSGIRRNKWRGESSQFSVGSQFWIRLLRPLTDSTNRTIRYQVAKKFRIKFTTVTN